MYLEKLGHQLQQLTKTIPSSPFFRHPTAIWKKSCSRVSSTNSDYHEKKGGLVDRWLGPNAGVSRPEEGTNRYFWIVRYVMKVCGDMYFSIQLNYQDF